MKDGAQEKLGVCLWCREIVATAPIAEGEYFEIPTNSNGPMLPLSLMHVNCPNRPKFITARSISAESEIAELTRMYGDGPE